MNLVLDRINCALPPFKGCFTMSSHGSHLGFVTMTGAPTDKFHTRRYVLLLFEIRFRMDYVISVKINVVALWQY